MVLRSGNDVYHQCSTNDQDHVNQWEPVEPSLDILTRRGVEGGGGFGLVPVHVVLSGGRFGLFHLEA